MLAPTTRARSGRAGRGAECLPTSGSRASAPRRLGRVYPGFTRGRGVWGPSRWLAQNRNALPLGLLLSGAVV